MSKEPLEKSLLLRLVRETFPQYKWQYVLAFTLMAVVACATASFGFIIKPLINGVFGEKSLTLAIQLSLGITVIFLIKGFAAYGNNVILSRIGNGIVASQQKRMFRALLEQPVAYMQSHSTGDTLTRITANARSVRDIMQMLIVSAGRDFFTVIALIFVMLVQDPLLFLISIVTMPIAVLGVNNLRRRVKRYANEEFFASSNLASIIQETVQGIRVVKAYNLKAARVHLFDRAVSDVENRANKIARLSARTTPLMETLGGLAIAGVVLYGGYSMMGGKGDAGTLSSFLVSLLLAYEPGKRLARLQVQLEHAMAGAKLMYELVDEVPSLVEKSNAVALNALLPGVAFNGVSFSYNDILVLENLSFNAEPNQTTAFIGASGSGKSTILSLIHRFQDVKAGSITINAQDVRDVTTHSLNNALAYVGQETFLFQGTIYDNIAQGREDATREEIELAAIAAFAHDFIIALPDGYKTKLAEFGAGLSGGQKQRLALARAFLKDAPILLLDEATSALDSESEAHIQKAIAAISHQKTVIVVAHRLSTITNADKIIVMDEGRILEQGSHKELLMLQGKYAQMIGLQKH